MHILSKYLVILFCLLASSLVVSQTVNDLVIDTTGQVLEQLGDNRPRLEADPESIKQVVRDLIVPHFDFEEMSELVMANNWDKLDSSQRGCFVSGFRNLLVERYAYILLSYNNQNISYQSPVEIGNEGYIMIRQVITRDGATPLPIDYAMHRVGDKWLAADLIIDGVSLVRNYRGMFQSQIHLQGIDYFLSKFPGCSN